MVLPLLLAVGCGSVIAPDRISNSDIQGIWNLRPVGPCSAFRWFTRLEIQQVESSLRPFSNVTGVWQSRRPREAHVPEGSTFTGSIDRTTGHFEFLLWSHGRQKGLLTGTLRKDGTATAEHNWGPRECLGVAGVRAVAG